jgi:hypothetical protein
MKVYSLIKKYCPDKISYNIGSVLGDGADGEVYSIVGTNDVIKFSVIYDIDFSENLELRYQDLSTKLDFIKNNTDDLPFAIVKDFKLLHIDHRAHVDGPQQFLIHYYVMEHLNKISDDEKKVIHTVFSHEDYNIKKNFEEKELKKILSGLSVGLDFSINKVILFWSKINKSILYHTDIHVRNVMKDNFGNFKLIDLDRLEWRKDK